MRVSAAGGQVVAAMNLITSRDNPMSETDIVTSLINTVRVLGTLVKELGDRDLLAE